MLKPHPFTARVVRAGLAIVFMLVVTDPVRAEHHIRVRISGAPTESDNRLTEDLNVLLTVGGRFLGHNAKDVPIFERSEDAVRVQDTQLTVQVLDDQKEVTSEPVNQVILTYGDGAPPSADDLAIAGFKLIEDYKPGRFLVLEAVQYIEAEGIRSLAASDNVLELAPNYEMEIIEPPEPARVQEAVVIKAAAAEKHPNDPRYQELWGMRNINASAAWANRAGDNSVIVAVIDTGVDYDHPDLRANMWVNPRETRNNRDDDGNGIKDDIHGAAFLGGRTLSGNPRDLHGHGTHCAGTIAAVGNNGIGVVGVNWNVKIMALRFLGGSGNGKLSDAVRCIDYAISKGADVMSNSWGANRGAPQLQAAISRAERAGILFVAAAANDGKNIDTSNKFPAGYNNANILSIAAIAEDNSLAGFSNFGRSRVDMAAPGVRILSSIPGNGFGNKNGTSMATPHVAGAAALIWNAVPSGNKARSVKTLLMNNARPEASLRGKCVTGATLDLSFVANSRPSRPGQPDPGTGKPKPPVKPPVKPPTKPTRPPKPVQPPPPRTAPIQVANGVSKRHFGIGSAVNTGQDIISAKVTLSQEGTVILRGSACTATTWRPVTFMTGMHIDSLNGGSVIAESTRLMTLDRLHEYTTFASQAAVKLPAGTHTVHWRLKTSGPTRIMSFRGGAMLMCSVLYRGKVIDVGSAGTPASPISSTTPNSVDAKTIDGMKSFVQSLVNRTEIVNSDSSRSKSLINLIKTLESYAKGINSATSIGTATSSLLERSDSFVLSLESLASQTPWSEAMRSLQSRLLSDAKNNPTDIRTLIESAVIPALREVQSGL